ncbi:hypothetical protein ABZZ80_06935 [Streptomyces sp. NPDC006356]
MFCSRCNKPLKANQAKAIDKLSTSGGGATIYVCKVLCKPVPTQTAPASRR